MNFARFSKLFCGIIATSAILNTQYLLYLGQISVMARTTIRSNTEPVATGWLRSTIHTSACPSRAAATGYGPACMLEAECEGQTHKRSQHNKIVALKWRSVWREDF